MISPIDDPVLETVPPARITDTDEVTSEEDVKESAELIGLETEQESIGTRSFTQPTAGEFAAVRKSKGTHDLDLDRGVDEFLCSATAQLPISLSFFNPAFLI